MSGSEPSYKLFKIIHNRQGHNLSKVDFGDKTHSQIQAVVLNNSRPDEFLSNTNDQMTVDYLALANYCAALTIKFPNKSLKDM